jgi:pimeloyl-ACP methyl ester carboxylesterase
MDTVCKYQSRNETVLTYRHWQNHQGKDSAIILIHGLASNYTRWSEFIEQTTLGERWDIIAPDMRGHGDSMTRERISLELWADDLSALLDHAGYKKAVLIGHSLGAHIALYFAHRFPQQTAGLILIDPLSENGFTASMRLLRRFRTLFQFLISIIRLPKTIGLYRRKLPWRDLRKLDEEARKILASGDTEAFVKRYSSPWPDLVHNSIGNYLQFVMEVVRPLPTLEHCEFPALLLLSGGSSFNQNDTKHSLSDICPQTQTTVIDANHWLLTEKPAESRKAIETWFQQHFQ